MVPYRIVRTSQFSTRGKSHCRLIARIKQTPVARLQSQLDSIAFGPEQLHNTSEIARMKSNTKSDAVIRFTKFCLQTSLLFDADEVNFFEIEFFGTQFNCYCFATGALQRYQEHFFQLEAEENFNLNVSQILFYNDRNWSLVIFNDLTNLNTCQKLCCSILFGRMK